MSFQIFSPSLFLNQLVTSTVSSSSEHVLSNKKLNASSTEIVSDEDPTKNIIFETDAATTNSTLTLVSNVTGDRTIIFPNEDGTLITAFSSDTLYNKIFDTNTLIFAHNGGSKRLQFDLGDNDIDTTITFYSEITGNRRFTMPDLSGTFATTQGSEILTNKSLVTNTVSFIDPDDISKKILFSSVGNQTNSSLTLASQTTTDRTITFPNATGTLALTTIQPKYDDGTVNAPTIAFSSENTGLFLGGGAINVSHQGANVLAMNTANIMPQVQITSVVQPCGIFRATSQQSVGTASDFLLSTIWASTVSRSITHASGVFTIASGATFDGIYIIKCNVSFQASTGTRDVWLRLNGTTTRHARTTGPVTSGAIQTRMSVSLITSMAGGGTVEVFVRQDSGTPLSVPASLTIQDEMAFSMCKLF